MKEKIIIVGVCGSLRKESYNRKLMNIAATFLSDEVEFIEAGIAELPLFNEDLEEPNGGRPQPVVDFRAILAKADGFLFVSPEYNYSVSGVFKNAIDWASRGQDSPIVGKPASLMGASMGLFGTNRAQLACYPTFQFLNIELMKKPEVFIMQAHTKFDEQGKLTDDYSLTQIKENVQNLIKLIKLRSK